MMAPWQVLGREHEQAADDIQELHRAGEIHAEPLVQISFNRLPRDEPAGTADCGFRGRGGDASAVPKIAITAHGFVHNRLPNMLLVICATATKLATIVPWPGRAEIAHALGTK